MWKSLVPPASTTTWNGNRKQGLNMCCDKEHDQLEEQDGMQYHTYDSDSIGASSNRRFVHVYG